jgi:SPP1 family predicted phage head-tail adaptor
VNHRITLLQRVVGQDAAGQPSTNWPSVASVWADVRFQTGAEVMRAGAEVVIKRVSVRLRARAGLDETFRLRYKGEDYDVKSALPDADRQFMFLVCESVK